MTKHPFIAILIGVAGVLTVGGDALAVYHPTLGRFIQRDPLGYPDGMNTYAAYHVMHGGVDPMGLVLVIDETTNNDRRRQAMLRRYGGPAVIKALRDICPCLEDGEIEVKGNTLGINRTLWDGTTFSPGTSDEAVARRERFCKCMYPNDNVVSKFGDTSVPKGERGYAIGCSMVLAILQHSRTVNIQLSRTLGNVQHNGTIEWDPFMSGFSPRDGEDVEDALKRGTSRGAAFGNSPRFIDLAHEFGHLLTDYYGTNDISLEDKERVAIQVENSIRYEAGLKNMRKRHPNTGQVDLVNDDNLFDFPKPRIKENWVKKCGCHIDGE